MISAPRLFFVLLALPIAANADGPAKKPLAPAAQFQALVKEFNTAAYGLHQARTDDERAKMTELGAALSPRCLELADKYPKDPVALPALVQVVMQEVWLENNTSHPGRGKNNLEAKAIAQILRDHLQSDKLGEACWRCCYGFSKDTEDFLRTILEKSPHREIRGTACLRLAMFLNGRLQKLELLRGRPEMVKRYENWFGKEYVEQLQRQNRAKAIKEVEALYERAAEQFAEVKMPYGEKVGARAKIELHEMRHLIVGKKAPDIDSQDQDGQQLQAQRLSRQGRLALLLVRILSYLTGQLAPRAVARQEAGRQALFAHRRERRQYRAEETQGNRRFETT